MTGKHEKSLKYGLRQRLIWGAASREEGPSTVKIRQGSRKKLHKPIFQVYETQSSDKSFEGVIRISLSSNLEKLEILEREFCVVPEHVVVNLIGLETRPDNA